MNSFFTRSGNRRTFITFTLIMAFLAMVYWKAPEQHVSFMGGAMMLALGYWFSQHTDKPNGTA